MGKSTELAAAQQALYKDRFAFRIGIDLTFDMRRIQAGEVFTHILQKFVAARPDADVETKLHLAEDLVGGDRRDFRRDLARKALRAVGNATLLVDGLEKADENAARAVAEELFALGDDADIVLVVPAALAYGPGAAILGEDVRLFPVRPVLVWGSPREDAIHGRLFLREVALRHLDQERPDDNLLDIVDRECVPSGGIPRVLLQLLRDAHRHAIVAGRSTPNMDDLMQAEHDHGEHLRRSLLPGDVEALIKAEGQDGSEVPLDRKLRFLLQGHLLEYRRGDHVVMHMAPTLARALRFPQDLT
ncbi:MAG TPA: hypothetical protein VLS89_02030 [Candidatus Nanopelagicales bacterium]|nr:hypothetical protein [Candidatus Nanopelagicales bacterium]